MTNGPSCSLLHSDLLPPKETESRPHCELYINSETVFSADFIRCAYARYALSVCVLPSMLKSTSRLCLLVICFAIATNNVTSSLILLPMLFHALWLNRRKCRATFIFHVFPTSLRKRAPQLSTWKRKLIPYIESNNAKRNEIKRWMANVSIDRIYVCVCVSACDCFLFFYYYFPVKKNRFLRIDARTLCTISHSSMIEFVEMFVRSIRNEWAFVMNGSNLMGVFV